MSSKNSNPASMVHFKEAIHFLLDDLETILGIKNINGNVRILSMDIREFDKKYKAFIVDQSRAEKLVMLKRASEAITTLSYINHKTTFFRVEVLSFKQHGRFDVLRVLLKAFSHRDMINEDTLINIDSLVEYLEILEGYNNKNINTFSYKYIRLFLALLALGDFSQASIVSSFIISQIDICLNIGNYSHLNEQELTNARRKIIEQRDELSRNGKISSDPNIELEKGEHTKQHEVASDSEVLNYVHNRKEGATTDETIRTPKKSTIDTVKDNLRDSVKDAGVVVNSEGLKFDVNKFKTSLSNVLNHKPKEDKPKREEPKKEKEEPKREKEEPEVETPRREKPKEEYRSKVDSGGLEEVDF